MAVQVTPGLHHLYLPNEKVDRLGEFTIQGVISKHSLTSNTTSIFEDNDAFTILHSYVNSSRYSNEKCVNNDVVIIEK